MIGCYAVNGVMQITAFVIAGVFVIGILVACVIAECASAMFAPDVNIYGEEE